MPNSGTATVTLTVSRISNTAALALERNLLQASGGLAILLLFFLGRRRRKAALFLNRVALVLFLGMVAFLAACGGGGSTTPPPVPPAPGSYPFSVTATSSGHSAAPVSLTLMVQ